jgi:hypothetical protein
VNISVKGNPIHEVHLDNGIDLAPNCNTALNIIERYEVADSPAVYKLGDMLVPLKAILSSTCKAADRYGVSTSKLQIKDYCKLTTSIG